MASVALAPLRHRSFALAVISNFTSSVGTWMQSVALGVHFTETTHNPVWLGLLTFCGWLPAIVGSPLGGIVADRFDRQKWIQLNNFIMTITATLLAVALFMHHLTPFVACTLALIEGLSSSSSWAGWQSLLRDLVDTDEVVAAISLSSAQFNLGRIIGPVLAAVALGFGSPAICFVANAVSFAVVVIMFFFVRTKPRAKVLTKVQPMKELVVGMKQAWRVLGCRYPIIGVGIVGLIISPFITLIPAMAIDVLHSGRVGTSWLVTAQGVGAVIAAFTLPAVTRRKSRAHVIKYSMAMLAIGDFLYAVSPNFVCAMLSLTLLGGAYVGALNGFNAAVQLYAPVSERSRILSLYTLSLSVFYPFGALLQSWLSKLVGIREITEISAGLMALVVIYLVIRGEKVWSAISGPVVEAQ